MGLRESSDSLSETKSKVRPKKKKKKKKKKNSPGSLLTTVGMTVLLFCDVHFDKGMILNLLQCLRVICACRAIQTNSAETSLGLLAI